MRVKKDGNKIVYTFKGDLEKEIRKSESELKHIDQYYDYYEWCYNDAKRKFESKKKRREELRDFIKLAKEELEKRKNGESTSEDGGEESDE